MFWILLTLKCLAVVSITGFVMMSLPDGRLTDMAGTATWVALCVAIARHDLRKRP
jgi:hypothetical protein